MKKRLGILCLLLAACGPRPEELNVSSSQAKENQKQLEEQVIYGEDHRLENYQASEAHRSLAASTVALVKSSSLVADSSGRLQLLGSIFGDAYQLCSSEPFREQVSGAFCSGSLVGPDTIITAGHCIRTVEDCRDVRFVFDFAVLGPGPENRLFTKDQVYSCREIIRREEIGTGADFAVIRLDRKVVGRNSLKYRKSGVAAVGDSLLVIGHPAGIPQKIAGGAQVRSVSSQHFVANLDTYGGNSGSAVFNATTNEVEGILVRGESDFKWQGSCSVSNRCTDGNCRGEDVTRIDQVVAYLQDEPVLPPPVEQDQIFSVTANLNIPDSPKAGVRSSVSVSALPNGRKVRVLIDLQHTYRGDLLVELISPSGKTVTLHERTGGSLDDLRGTYGVDLVSAQSLESLSQENKQGNWSLRVTDKAAVDVGVLKKWSLIFSAK